MIDIDEVFAAIARAEAAFTAVRDIGDAIAATLADSGQPQLQLLLGKLREENDAAFARRRRLLDRAAEEE